MGKICFWMLVLHWQSLLCSFSLLRIRHFMFSRGEYFLVKFKTAGFIWKHSRTHFAFWGNFFAEAHISLTFSRSIHANLMFFQVFGNLESDDNNYGGWNFSLSQQICDDFQDYTKSWTYFFHNFLKFHCKKFKSLEQKPQTFL